MFYLVCEYWILYVTEIILHVNAHMTSWICFYYKCAMVGHYWTENAIIGPVLLQGPVSLTIFPLQFKVDGNFNSHSNSTEGIATEFCSWHTSISVMACKNFCWNLLTMNWIASKWIFHWIGIEMKKKIVSDQNGPKIWPIIAYLHCIALSIIAFSMVSNSVARIFSHNLIGHVTLVAITGTYMLVPYHLIKSL